MENQDWIEKGKKNTKNLAVWTMTWTFSMALATFGPKFLWAGNTTLTIIGILINLLFGAGMIMANIRYLNGLDDLQRKIHMDGMALALGVGVVGGLSYSLLDVTNILGHDAEISVLVIIMALTYLVSVLIGVKRYK